MAYAMTKQGSRDNVLTYEFMCDTTADLSLIENEYRTLGSVAIVLQGESGLEIYICGSSKEWALLNVGGGSGGSADIDLSDYLQKSDIAAWAKAAQKPTYTAQEVGAATTADITAAIAQVNTLQMHVCTQQEVSNGLPDIAEPDTETIYLVASGNETGNLYEEFVYVNNAWEKIGVASIDLSGYATVANPVFTGSISLGRKENTTIGEKSLAIGNNTVASGNYSYAIGDGASASGTASHAEQKSLCPGSYSHSEALSTAYGDFCHTEGSGKACGSYSHVEGKETIGYGASIHISGKCNIDDVNQYPLWATNTQYEIGDIVKTSSNAVFQCKVAHISDSTFPTADWTQISVYNYAEIIGNGTGTNARSNARALTWTGDEYLAGDVYVHANPNSTGGTKLATVNDIPVTAVDDTPVTLSFGTLTVGDDNNVPTMTLDVTTALEEGPATLVIGSDEIPVHMAITIDDQTEKTYYMTTETLQDGTTPLFALQYTGTGTSSTTVSYMAYSDETYAEDQTIALKFPREKLTTTRMGLYVGCESDGTGGDKLATEGYINARIPTPPVSDGTYNLQLAISSGIATYSWVLSSGDVNIEDNGGGPIEIPT